MKRTAFFGIVTLFMLATLIAGTAAGAGIEIIQQMTGYRSCDIMDFRADCLGLLAGAVLTTIYGAASKKW